MSIEDTIAQAVERAAERVLAVVAQNGKPRLLRREQAARHLGCDPTHLDRLVARGVITPVRWPIEGAQKRQTPYFDLTDLDAAIEEHKGK